MASPFSWPALVPYALRAPAPVNLGVRLFAKTSHIYSLGLMKMRTAISGSKEEFAIECVVQDHIKGLGNIYFWLAGVRFGNDLFPFELPAYF